MLRRTRRESAWILRSVYCQYRKQAPSPWPGKHVNMQRRRSIRVERLQSLVCRRHRPSLVAPFDDACVLFLRASGCFMGPYNSPWTNGWMIDDGDRVDVPGVEAPNT